MNVSLCVSECKHYNSVNTVTSEGNLKFCKNRTYTNITRHICVIALAQNYSDNLYIPLNYTPQYRETRIDMGPKDVIPEEHRNGVDDMHGTGVLDGNTYIWYTV